MMMMIMMVMKTWAVATEKYHGGEQDRWADRETERHNHRKRHLEANSWCPKFCERNIYECRTSAEIFRSNIYIKYWARKQEETNNRRWLSMFLDLLLT
jgi:hypothetical protein